MKKNFAIVLLHYNTLDDTRRLVEEIEKEKYFLESRIEIIIVDNASPNGSGLSIKKMYSSKENVTVINLKENIGFARGNNIGYRYAMENFELDFIILSNTDILLKSENFFESIEEAYKNESFALMGPDILRRKNSDDAFIHQNPKFIEKEITITSVKKDIYEINKNKLRANFGLRMRQIPFVGLCYSKVMQKKNRKLINEEKDETQNFSMKSKYLMLHGAFMVFSKQFLDKFPNGLDEQTFMYGEEHFISYYCQRERLPILYQPKIKVIHLEGNATRSEKSIIQRNTFLRKEATKSLKRLIKLIENDKILRENTMS